MINYSQLSKLIVIQIPKHYLVLSELVDDRIIFTFIVKGINNSLPPSLPFRVLSFDTKFELRIKKSCGYWQKIYLKSLNKFDQWVSIFRLSR